MGCSSSTSAQNVRFVTPFLTFYFIASVRLHSVFILSIAVAQLPREVMKIQLSLKKPLEPEEDLTRLPVKPLLPKNQRTSQNLYPILSKTYLFL